MIPGDPCQGRCPCPKCGGPAHWFPGSPNIKAMHACADPECSFEFEAHTIDFWEPSADGTLLRKLSNDDAYEAIFRVGRL